MSFLEIFQPELKFQREEAEREKMLVVRHTHGGGAPLGIDLDAGTAAIVIPAGKARGDTDPQEGPADHDSRAAP